jgi:hypothetical protein
MIDAFIALQAFVVLFITLHDWVPLGTLNDVAAVRSTDGVSRLARVTLLSALPFVIALVGTIWYAHRRFPDWLFWLLWLSYGGAIYGMLRTWWIPYLILPEPARAARYQRMFGRTHSCLPARNGIRPNTLHVALHMVLIAVLVILTIITVRS